MLFQLLSDGFQAELLMSEIICGFLILNDRAKLICKRVTFHISPYNEREHLGVVSLQHSHNL